MSFLGGEDLETGDLMVQAKGQIQFHDFQFSRRPQYAMVAKWIELSHQPVITAIYPRF